MMRGRSSVYSRMKRASAGKMLQKAVRRLMRRMENILLVMSYLLLYAFHFNQFAWQGNPDGGALAFLRLELDLSTHVLDEFMTDAKTQTCACVGTSDEAFEDVLDGLLGDA